MTPVEDTRTLASCFHGCVSSPSDLPVDPSTVFCTTFCTPIKETHHPVYKKVTYLLEYGQVVVPEHMSSNVLTPSKEHPTCPCNYDESPGSMESDGMGWLMKRLYTMTEGYVL